MTSINHQNETVTFRVNAALKADLRRLAAEKHQSLGTLIRDLAEERMAHERRQGFEAEADRQAAAATAAARDSDSDEHTVLRELENDLEAFDNEWK